MTVFGTKFVTMKKGMNSLRGLNYKLKMMVISISGPSYIYGDNMSVVLNASWPESLLRKKSNSVCYPLVHESVSVGESLVGHIPSNENAAESLMNRKVSTWSVICYMIFIMIINQQRQSDMDHSQASLSLLAILSILRGLKDVVILLPWIFSQGGSVEPVLGGLYIF